MARIEKSDQIMRDALRRLDKPVEIADRCVCLQFGSSVCTGGCETASVREIADVPDHKTLIQMRPRAMIAS